MASDPTPQEPQSVVGDIASVDPALIAEAQVLEAPAPPLRRRNRFRFSVKPEWFRTRRPLVVVAFGLLVLGAVGPLSVLFEVLGTYPVAGQASVLLWTLYAVPLILLINSFDFFEREPALLIAGALVWGGFIAAGMALNANEAFIDLLAASGGTEFAETWGPAVVAPFVEEPLKTAGIVAVILMSSRMIRGSVDGFVVGAMLGLGFQCVENFVYTANALFDSSNQDKADAIVSVFLARGVASGLWSHAAYSGIVGLGVGFAFTRLDLSRGRRIGAAVAAFLVAWSLHLLWNMPWPFDDVGALSAALRGMLIIGVLLIGVHEAQSRESEIYTRHLRTIDDPRLVARGEAEYLRNYRTRRARVRQVRREQGQVAAMWARRLQRAQADLALAVGTGDEARRRQATERILLARRAELTEAFRMRRMGVGVALVSLLLSLGGFVAPLLSPSAAIGVAIFGWYRVIRKEAEPAALLVVASVVAVSMFLLGAGAYALRIGAGS